MTDFLYEGSVGVDYAWYEIEPASNLFFVKRSDLSGFLLDLETGKLEMEYPYCGIIGGIVEYIHEANVFIIAGNIDYVVFSPNPARQLIEKKAYNSNILSISRYTTADEVFLTFGGDSKIEFVSPIDSIGCHYSCATCSANLHQKKCLTCNSGFNLDVATSTCKPKCDTPINTYYSIDTDLCIPKCGDNEFLTKTGICEKCSSNCEKCKNAGICQTCKPGFRRLATGVCDLEPNPAPIGQYLNTTANLFQYCNPFCSECTGPSAKDCSGKCKTDIHIQNKGGECTDKCLERFFFNWVDLNCSPCKPHCLNCHSQFLDHCSACESGWLLSHGICVSECPEGYTVDKEGKGCIHTS